MAAGPDGGGRGGRNRGEAWALAQAMGLAWNYRETNPAMAAVGRRTLAQLVADLD